MALGALVALWVVGLVWMWVVGSVRGEKGIVLVRVYVAGTGAGRRSRVSRYVANAPGTPSQNMAPSLG